MWLFQLNSIISDPVLIIEDVKKYASSEGLTLEEYLMWTVDNNLSSHFLNLLFQVSFTIQPILSFINLSKTLQELISFCSFVILGLPCGSWSQATV